MENAEKEKPSIVSRFFSNTSFAGFREAYESQSIFWKILWGSCILLCTALTIYQLYGLINNYVNQPTVTVIKPMSNDYEFPQIWFGYAHEAADNNERERILGHDQLGNESFEYLKSFMSLRQYNIDSKPFDINAVRRRVISAMAKNNFTSAAQLFKSMFATDQLPLTYMKQGNVRVDKAIGGIYSIFYLVSLNGTEANKGQAKKVKMLFQYGLSGPVKAWLNPYDSIEELSIDDTTVIEYKLTKTIKLSAAKRPCRADKGNDFTYTVVNCKTECAQKRWREKHPEYPCTPWDAYLWIYGVTDEASPVCTHGITFQYSENITGAGTLGGYYNSTLDEEAQNNEDALLAECANVCFLPCQQWIVETTITRKPWTSGEASVEIQYPNAALILVMEETYTFAWESFVGNVGGILGLWLGANLLSVLQAFYLCVGDRGRSENHQLDKLSPTFVRDMLELQKKYDAKRIPFTELQSPH